MLFVCGAVAGTINGLIGCGGGIIIVYVLSFLFGKGHEADETTGETEEKDIFAFAVLSVLPMTAVSVINYLRGGTGLPENIESYIVPAFFGGIAGAFLLEKISSKWLKKIFSLLVIWAGVSLILKETGIM